MSTTVLEEDFQGIAGDKTLFARENLEKLERCTVVITGATGLVGSLLLRSLLYLNDTCALHLTVIPVIRNEEKLKTILGEIPAAVCPVMADVTERDFVKEAGEKIRKILEHTGSQEPGEQAQEDRKEEGSRAKECREEEEDRKSGRGNLYFFHCAAVTTSKTMVEKPVETIAASCDGTRNLLETASVLHADSFVYLSSMEVYGDMSVYGDGNTRATEDRLGVLDLLKVRTDYPESKRLCENLCCAYHAEYGVPVKIARLAQTFGAGILPWERRVFAQFANSAMQGSDIVLHTKGLSEGNYCYTADCVRGLLYLLLMGEDGTAYNVANESCHTTIGGMAEMVADTIAEGKIHVVYDIPKTNTFGYAADTHLFLDSTKLRSLGWAPKTDLPEMYRRMIRYLEETEEKA